PFTDRPTQATSWCPINWRPTRTTVSSTSPPSPSALVGAVVSEDTAAPCTNPALMRVPPMSKARIAGAGDCPIALDCNSRGSVTDMWLGLVRSRMKLYLDAGTVPSLEYAGILQRLTIRKVGYGIQEKER